MGAGCFKTSAIIMRAPGASGQLRRSDDWFLFVCPRRKERKKLTKKERKVYRASEVYDRYNYSRARGFGAIKAL